MELYLTNKPRLQVFGPRDVAAATHHEFGRELTRLALFPSQYRLLLQKDDDDDDDDDGSDRPPAFDVTLLHGPPGSGKSFLLVLRGRRWTVVE